MREANIGDKSAVVREANIGDDFFFFMVLLHTIKRE